MKLLRRKKEREKKKRASANNKGADQSARPRRLICAFVVRLCIKASFLSGSYGDLNHRSSTNRTTFWLVSIQWRTNIHTWSTFLRGLIQNSTEVKATVSKTARRNEE